MWHLHLSDILFIKPIFIHQVTVERDLHVRRFVQDNVIVWDLLNLLAQNRPALCYCSVLLRALLATLLSHWANCQERQAKDSRDSLS